MPKKFTQPKMTPKERLDTLLLAYEARIEELLTGNPVESMTAYEREQSAVKYGLLVVRLLELQQQQEDPDAALSGNALIARVIGLTVTEEPML